MMDLVVLGCQLDFMTLMVFYNLNDPMVLIGIEHIHSVHRCAL